jgi:hypothetical protein
MDRDHTNGARQAVETMGGEAVWSFDALESVPVDFDALARAWEQQTRRTLGEYSPRRKPLPESEGTAGHPNEPASYGKKSQLELVRQRVLLEDLSQEDIDRSERFLTITPSEWGSGSSDVSINHDRHLYED